MKEHLSALTDKSSDIKTSTLLELSGLADKEFDGFVVVPNDTVGIAGVIEQAIVLGLILPATGWWFSFFALTAVFNLVAGGFRK